MSASPRTHQDIDPELCGEPVSLESGEATVRFRATERMRVDGRGLVHGGFVFGLADHAAMLAVDEPEVVLGSADVRFVAPVEVGDEVVARATVVESEGARYEIEATASIVGGDDEDEEVLSGTFTAFVPDEHILD